jgi:hypothetical protein
MNNLGYLNPYRDQIECPMIKELFEYEDEINELRSHIHKLSKLSDNLEKNIIQKYPLLSHIGVYSPKDITSEYVYYINNKHQSVQSHD